MRFFVTGHKGLLGKKIMKMVHDSGGEVLYDNDLDVTKEIYIPENTDVVIHCAAMTNVDGCERERYEAWKVNVEGTVNVANVCKEINAKMVLISTDYVLKPTNFYALTKLVAEEEAQKILQNLLIVRTSTLYGYNGKEKDRPTFVTWVLSQKENIKTVTDNITHPTLIDDLVENIIKLLKENRTGIVNVVGKDCISKHAFADAIIKVFGLKVENEKIWSGQLKNWIAKRPRRLKLQNSPGVETHTVVEGLEIMKKQMEE